MCTLLHIPLSLPATTGLSPFFFAPTQLIVQDTKNKRTCPVKAAALTTALDKLVPPAPPPTPRPTPPPPPPPPPPYNPVYCAGQHGDVSDDDVDGSGHQLLWVDVAQSECNSTTIPLLASDCLPRRRRAPSQTAPPASPHGPSTARISHWPHGTYFAMAPHTFGAGTAPRCRRCHCWRLVLRRRWQRQRPKRRRRDRRFGLHRRCDHVKQPAQRVALLVLWLLLQRMRLCRRE